MVLSYICHLKAILPSSSVHHYIMYIMYVLPKKPFKFFLSVLWEAIL